ncbi:methyl-accepting chemotaxis protein [Mameliella sp.]|uniref:methyl-accepting chemotaxis protein n=1 Tax=Mameliella sp. TaxID=1924940 RepID=UPI003BAD65F8
MTQDGGKTRSGAGLHSVFIRCAGIMAVTTIVVAAVLSVQSLRLVDDLAVKGVVDQAARTVELSASALNKPIRFKALPKVEEEVSAAMTAAGANGRVAMVLGAEGERLAAVGEDTSLLDSVADLAARALADGTRISTEGGLWVAEPVLAGPEGPVIGVIAMAWNADSALADVRPEKMSILLTAAAVFIVLLGATLFLLQRSLGRPLRQVTEAVERISDGDYDSEIGMSGRRDEFGSIAARMQDMTRALSVARDAEKERARNMERQVEMVSHLGQALDVLAEGVLNREIVAEFPEEYAALRTNYNRAIASLRRVVDEVSASADSLLDNANQIASASDDLSRRTETQAATLEESAAALEELLSSVSAAAENARNADDQVRQTREIAERNGEVMRSAIEAMSVIEKSSEQIGEITSVIDDIAFQTNLLALNAGVEAARAGESGKGFAVVATEVRGLAQRSAAAAQQIKELITGAGEQVASGVRLVEEAGGALDGVLSRVAEVSNMMTGIASSAGEQAQGLQEINVGISNLDRVTQQNAAMVEESTASAHMMRSDAGALSETVGRFVTGSDTRTPGVAGPEAAAGRIRAA